MRVVVRRAPRQVVGRVVRDVVPSPHEPLVELIHLLDAILLDLTENGRRVLRLLPLVLAAATGGHHEVCVLLEVRDEGHVRLCYVLEPLRMLLLLLIVLSSLTSVTREHVLKQRLLLLVACLLYSLITNKFQII